MALTKALFIPAKDPSGDPTPLCVNANGELIVTSESPGVFITDDANSVTPTDTTFYDVNCITGALNKCYDNFELMAQSVTETEWQLCYIDDAAGTPVERTLATWVTGPGQYTVCCNFDGPKIDTSSGTGVQEFKIKGRAIDAGCLGCFSSSLALKCRDA